MKTKPTAFFNVSTIPRPRGIPYNKFQSFLTVGRWVRWSGCSAEYGLGEAQVAPHRAGDEVRLDHGGTTSGHYWEHIKEIALTENEARQLGLGWPGRGLARERGPLLSRSERQTLAHMLAALEEWRWAEVGNPDPAPLARFDRNLEDARNLCKKLRAR